MPTVASINMDAYFSGSDGPTGDNEVTKLRGKHRLWTKYAPLWDFFLSAYESGSEFVNGTNLFRHVRENQKDYEDRIERLHNLNYCEPLVDFFTNFIYAETIDRNGGTNADLFNTLLDNVNLKGDSVDDFMRSVSDDMQIFGLVYGLVDTPAIPDEIFTKLDEIERNIRPYWILVKPDEITDWVTDDFGTYQYVKRMQQVQEIINGETKQVERYTEWYLDHITVSKVDVTTPGKPIYMGAGTVPNELGEIPLARCIYKPSKRDSEMGLSFLRDFAYNNREIMNLTSLLQEFLYRQAFNILAREVESGVPIRDQEDGVIGTSNVMDVPKGAKMPEYISPPADPAKFIQEERARLKNEMFARASQDAMNELFNGQGSSGFAKAQSFSKTVPFIASRADSLEAFERRMFSLSMKWAGKQWDGKIQYKDRYEITNLTDALTQFMTLCRDLMMPSEDFIKEELKRFALAFDGKFPQEVSTIILKQIEGMDVKEWMDTQRQVLIGPPTGEGGQSPGEQQKSKQTGTMAEAAKESAGSGGATKALKGPQKK